MARVVWTGGETGIGPDVHLNNLGISSLLESSLARSGVYGMLEVFNGHSAIVPNAGPVLATFPMNLTELYHRCYFRVAGAGTSLVSYRNNTNSATIVQIDPTASSTLQVTKPPDIPLATGTTVLSPNRWYRLEVHLVISPTSGVAEIRLDGAPEITATGLDLGSDPIGFVNHDGHATGRYVFDDIAVDDAAWPGEGSVWSMVPVADGSLNGWTTNAGAGVPLYSIVRPHLPYGGYFYEVYGPNLTNQTTTGLFLRFSSPAPHLDLQNPRVALVINASSYRGGIVGEPDTLELGAQLYLDDETTTVSNEVVLTNPDTNEHHWFAPVTLTYPLTRQDWSRLAVRLRQMYSAQGGADGTAQIRIKSLALSLELSYTPRHEVAILGVV